MAIAMNELTNMLMRLPDKQRAQLVANLLASLPGVLTDEDEGAAEALRAMPNWKAARHGLFRSKNWTPRSKTAAVTDAADVSFKRRRSKY